MDRSSQALHSSSSSWPGGRSSLQKRHFPFLLKKTLFQDGLQVLSRRPSSHFSLWKSSSQTVVQLQFFGSGGGDDGVAATPSSDSLLPPYEFSFSSSGDRGGLEGGGVGEERSRLISGSLPLSPRFLHPLLLASDRQGYPCFWLLILDQLLVF